MGMPQRSRLEWHVGGPPCEPRQPEWIAQPEEGVPPLGAVTDVDAPGGASFGSALAIAISWSVHHSILWAIIHGIFSWLYVIYYAFTR